MQKIKAVIFDVDGTLLDTREFILQAVEHSLEHHGHPISKRHEIIKAVTGKPLDEAYTNLVPEGDISSLQDIHREFQKRRFDLVNLYEGLHDVLTALCTRGILLGICSTRGSTLRSSLEHANILEYFDAVIDASNVKHHKPHPEGVLKALEILNVAPQHSAMIGDTIADIGAGKAAGCVITIGISHGLGTRESLEDAGADHVVDSLQDILMLV